MTNSNHEWQLSPDFIHLNHAAVGPWPQRTKTAVQEFAEDNAVNGSLNYMKWVDIENELRCQLKQLINADSSGEISLVKNTSEALSVIAYGLEWQSGDNVVISDQEFPSNYIVWESLRDQGVEIRYANLSGESPEENLIALCDKKTRLLSISSVQYSTGLKMNLKILGDFCHSENILFCIDAIQSIGAHAIDVEDCKADFVVADGHKWMLGPEGVALFYCRENVRDLVQLKQFGWRMVEDFLNFDNKTWEIAKSGRRFECGSPNMLGIHGLHASLSLILEHGIININRQIEYKMDLLINGLGKFSEIDIKTPLDPARRCGIFTFGFNRNSLMESSASKNNFDKNTKPMNTDLNTGASAESQESQLFKYLSSKNVFCAMRGGGVRLSPHYHTFDGQIEKVIQYISEYLAVKNEL